MPRVRARSVLACPIQGSGPATGRGTGLRPRWGTAHPAWFFVLLWLAVAAVAMAVHLVGSTY